MTTTARIRNSGEIGSIPFSSTRHSMGVLVASGSGDMPNTSGEHKYMFDYVTTNYDKLSSRGVVINKPMHKTKTTRSTVLTDFKREQMRSVSPFEKIADYADSPVNKLTREGASGINMGPVQHLFVDIDTNQLRTLAGTQAAASIAEPEFHGLTFVAELRETISFLHSPLRAYNRWLKRSLRKQRKSNKRHELSKKDVITLADSLSSNWLAYRYGALPLIYDIRDAIAAITALDEATNRHIARGFSTNYGTNSNDIEHVATWSSTKKEIQTRRTVEVRAGILYEVDTRDTYGVSMSQIPITAWEVIPFSFVADWFVNINDFVAAITPKAGVKVLSSWTAVKDTYQTDAQGIQEVGSDPVQFPVSLPATSTESFITEDYNRSPSHAVGIASRPIPYEGDLGTKRIIDTLALTFQLLNSKV